MKKIIMTMAGISLLAASCTTAPKEEAFDYNVDRFNDIQVLRYQVPGFEELTVQQKELVYYLTEAALQGRDILFDQNGKYNMSIRRTLEAIYQNYKGDKESADYKAFETYLKCVWFANGIHHHYSGDKFTPAFSQQFFVDAVKSLDPSQLPLKEGEDVTALLARLTPVIFDPTVDSKHTNTAAGVDVVATSAGNYYDGVTQAEAEAFYAKMKDPKDNTPVSYGLLSRLIKKDGVVQELTYKVGGLYSPALEKVVYWLQKALAVAENDKQKAVIEKLITVNLTGDLKAFDDYAITWLYDTDSRVDFVNGFTETYGDPLGMKASWESIVNFKNMEATKRTIIISDNAQWFEDNSPVAPQFKKEKVKGVSAKVINVAILAGDCYPSTPIGINLPNSNWIRRDHGSKSVTIENITDAYDKAAMGSGFNEEFVLDDTERESIAQYGFACDNLHTDLHECLGHGSGKLLPGVDQDALRSYGAPLEEARADLFALYYLADPKMVELGLVPNKDAYKSEYYKYLMNGAITQLTRIEKGKTIEQAHMRDRATIARWVIEKAAPTKAVELLKKEGKTYLKVNDYAALRALFGELLAEVQRIKSEGDFEGAKKLIEGYGVQVDPTLHAEILTRYEKLNLAPYKGFVNPIYTPVVDANGKITDVKVSYKEGYAEQQLRYSKDYSPLATYNN